MAIGAADQHCARAPHALAVRRLCAWMVLVGAVAGMPLAGAQPGPQSVATRSFHVAPGPLTQVLQQIASQARVLVYFDPVVTRDLGSDGLEGTYAPALAFEAVLRAHGLQAYEDAPGSFRVRRAWMPAVSILPTTQVEGEVQGFTQLQERAATKTLAPLVSVPQSVSVVTSADMQARGARSVTQALQYTPGVQVDNYGGTEVRNDWVVLRGFDAKLTGDYRDGLSQMPYDQIRARVPTYALEQIEVVRGPVSALYGQAAPGGIVNRVTKRPPETPLREAALQFGSFGHKQGYLDLGGPFNESGQARFRLTATARESGTQDKYDSGHRYRDNLAYVAPAFGWRDADTSFTLLLHYQHDRNDGESRVYYPTRVLVGDYDYDRNDRDFFSLGYQFEHRLNAQWRVRQNARYQHGDMLLRNLYAGALTSDGRTLARAQLQARERAEGLAVDSQVEGDLAGGGLRHRVLAGLDARRLSGRQHYQQAAAPGLDLLDPRYGQGITLPSGAPSIIKVRQVTEQWGLYLQDRIEAGDWTILLGARRDDHRDVTDNHLADTRTHGRGNAYTWRAGVSYAAGAGVAPYAGYATSFVPQAGASYDGKPFDPARAGQFEAGVKFQPPQSQSLYTLALFDLRQRNVLTADPDPAHPGFSVTTGRVRARGVELEAKVSPARGWDLLAAYTFNDVENLRANDGTVGKMPVVTPRQMASIWLNRSFGGWLAGWSAGVGVRHIGSTYVDAANTMKNDAATVVDAALAYDAGAWRVALDASNVFNRQTVVCRGDRGNCRYGVDRTVLATVAYRY
ncbi:Ferric hydroxamate uptake [Achromobacter xylosoxidans]|uniref:TonB-dependent siderophore receptor n=1 Tax=Alcaligenes xylosoxydans xylosoxydans TaxID=85698 RepID=UPI0006BF3C22|nr:TonB-dependent siderophore receptor [Achromobacter xylosoxidans]CUI59502.1 Ferric hydroxamate uptake [Achromobacter xylosoxidans]